MDTGISDWENDTGAYTNLYSDQVEEAFGLFGNSRNTDNSTANICGFTCDHKSCVEDKLLPDCDNRDSNLDDKIILIVTLVWLKKESIRLDGKNSNSISLYFVDHDQTYHSFHLENYSCDVSSVQDFACEELFRF